MTTHGVGIGNTDPKALLDVSDGTSTPTEAGPNDVYIQHNLEVDGAIYGDGSHLTGIQAGVTSFNGREGAVDPVSGDYTASEISGLANASINLGGDLSGTTTSATVSTIGGKAITAADTPNTIVERDSSGNFSAGTITATLNGSSTAAASGDLSGNYPGPTVASVGTSSAANIHTAEGLVNGSKTANTVFAAPNGSAGTNSNRLLVAADIPTLTPSQAGLGNVANLLQAPALVPVATVSGSTLTASVNTYYPLSTASNSIVVTLPNAPAANSAIEFKTIVVGGSNTVTIQRPTAGSTDVLNVSPNTSITCSALNQTVRISYATAAQTGLGYGVWLVDDGHSLAELNSLYSPAAGSTNIVTTGPITTGSWTATPVGTSYGGTGATSANTGLNALLPAQGSASGLFLKSNGTNAGWSSAITSIPVGSTIFVDAVNGNDTTGTRGRQDLPFLTGAAAISAVSAATDTIQFTSGTFTWPATGVVSIPCNVKGAGKYATFLVNADESSTDYSFTPSANNITIQDLTLQGDVTSGNFSCPVGWKYANGVAAATGVVFRNIQTLSWSDGIELANAASQFPTMYWRFENCTFTSHYDCFNLIPGSMASAWPLGVDFIDCAFNASYDGVTGGGRYAGIVCSAATGTTGGPLIRLYNCTMDLAGGTNTAGALGVYSQLSCTVEVHGGRITVSGAGTNNAFTASQHTATSVLPVIAVDNACVYDATTRTITSPAVFKTLENQTVMQGVTFGFTNVNASTYTQLLSDYFLGVSYTATGACTITLMSPGTATGKAIAGHTLIVKDTGGSASTNNITITAPAGVSIDGGSTGGSVTISTNHNEQRLFTDGSNWFTY